MIFEAFWVVSAEHAEHFIAALTANVEDVGGKVLSSASQPSPEGEGATDLRVQILAPLKVEVTNAAQAIITMYRQIAEGALMGGVDEDVRCVLMSITPVFSVQDYMSTRPHEVNALFQCCFNEVDRANHVVSALNEEVEDLRDEVMKLRASVAEMQNHPFFTLGYQAVINAVFNMAHRSGDTDLLPDLKTFQVH